MTLTSQSRYCIGLNLVDNLILVEQRMNSGVTREGMAVFGEWVRQARLSPEVRERITEWLKANPTEVVGEVVTQAQFARWLTVQTGFKVSDSVLGRLERANKTSAPPLEILVALTRVNVLQLPNGSYCTLNDAIAILSGELNPFTGERKENLNGANAH